MTTLNNCEYCDNYIPIGGGDIVCVKKQEPVLIMDEYEPTDNYGWCKNKED